MSGSNGKRAGAATADGLAGPAELDALLDAVERDCETGRPVDIEDLARRHPALAADLRRQVPAVLAMKGCRGGSDASHGKPGAPQEVLDGDRRLGDFRLLREIGKGGMGVVYEAEQVSLRRKVALKVLPLAGALDERALQRFRNEALAAASLEHPHVVSVYGVGCERATHFLAMKLIDGPPLSDVIRAARREAGLDDVAAFAAPARDRATGGAVTGSDPLAATVVGTARRSDASSAETVPVAALSTEVSGRSKSRYLAAARLIKQAAEALEYAHSLGVVHRDVKPSNLLLDSRGSLWVADFGLAHLEGDSSLTMTGDLMGTLRYMSPEQATGRRALVDHRSDVYSLGLTLYELLTLHPAFPQPSRADLLRAVIAEEPPRPRALAGSIPRDLETVVLKATAKDARKRYQTAKAFADDLGRFLAGEPVTAKRPGLAGRAARWARRHRAATVALATALLALTGFAAAEGLRDAAARRADDQAAREDLAAARAAFESGGFDVAGKEIAEAEGRNPSAAILGEADELKDALDKFRRFKEHADRARQSWDGGMQSEAGKALAVYGLPERDDWLEPILRSPLPEPQRAEVRQAVYELLLLLADYGEGGALASLGFLEKAAAARVPTHAFFYVRAGLRNGLGEWDAMRRDRAVAAATKPSIAIDHYIPARRAVWNGRREEGLAGYRAALRLDPRHLPSLFFLTLHTGADDPGAPNPQALEAKTAAWHGCAAVRPDYAVVRAYLAEAHRRLGRDREADEEYRIAERLRRDAIANSPGEAGVWTGLRALQSEFGRWEDVRDSYEQEMAVRADDGSLRLDAAEFYLTGPDARLRDRGRGLRLAGDVVRETQDLSLLSKAARLFARAGERDAGRQVGAAFDRELGRRPTDPTVAAKTAAYHLFGPDLALRDPERALQVTREAVTVWRKDFGPLLNAAAVFAAMGKTDEFRRVAELASVDSRGKDFPEVAHAVVRICTIAPGGPGDAEERVRTAERAAAEEPNPWHHHAVGMARLRAGRLDSAESAFRESLAGHWDADALNLAGMALAVRGLGRADEARRLRSEARRQVEEKRWILEDKLPAGDLLSWYAIDQELERMLAPVEAPRP